MTPEQSMILEIAKKHFPYATPNPGQLETVVEAVRAFRGGKKHVIVQAPTGIGKTAIATTVHRVMRELDENHRTTIITATKGLQDQYVASDKLVYDLKGKTNYACAFDVGPYNSGGCRAKVAAGGCKKQESCAYVMRRTHWCNRAQLRLTNNSFQIEACPSICMTEKNRADLIIADECHDLDDQIVQHTTIRFYANEYVNLRMFGYSDFVDDLRAYINLFHAAPIGVPFKITQSMYEGMTKLNEKVSAMIELFEGWLEQKDRHDHELVGDMLEALQQIGDKTEIFDSTLEGEWIVDEWKEGRQPPRGQARIRLAGV